MAVLLKLNGGLGNQLFQAAFALSIAEKTGKQVWIDTSFIEEHRTSGQVTPREVALGVFPKFPLQIAPRTWYKRVQNFRTKLHYRAYNRLLKKLGRKPAFSSVHQHQGDFFKVDQRSFDTSGDLIYVDGIFQNEAFFKESADTVRTIFTFPPFSTTAASDLARRIAQQEAPVSIHVRGGDYLTAKDVAGVLTVCPVEYYQQAVAWIKQRVPAATFFVFSDDMPHARQVLASVEGCEFVDVSSLSAPQDDMHLMTLCQHHIIANSTFSWWGAWLGKNPGKHVVAPLDYFPNLNVHGSQMCPPSWQLL
jgi:hypothetical protein